MAPGTVLREGTGSSGLSTHQAQLPGLRGEASSYCNFRVGYNRRKATSSHGVLSRRVHTPSHSYTHRHAHNGPGFGCTGTSVLDEAAGVSGAFPGALERTLGQAPVSLLGRLSWVCGGEAPGLRSRPVRLSAKKVWGSRQDLEC